MSVQVLGFRFRFGVQGFLNPKAPKPHTVGSGLSGFAGLRRGPQTSTPTTLYPELRDWTPDPASDSFGLRLGVWGFYGF